MIEKAINDEEYNESDIAQYITGPDLPDGGIITDNKDWLKIIQNGKGKIALRCKYEIKEDKKHNKYIEITELPYLVNK
jgi:DNA gyrase subunit A